MAKKAMSKKETRREMKRVAKLDKKIDHCQNKIDKWLARRIDLEAERDLGKKGRKRGRRQA